MVFCYSFLYSTKIGNGFARDLMLYLENICEENELLKRNVKRCIFKNKNEIFIALNLVKSELSAEKEKYQDLQNTWKKANETFVEQSLTMANQLEQMRRGTPLSNQSASDRNLFSHSASIFEGYYCCC